MPAKHAPVAIGPHVFTWSVHAGDAAVVEIRPRAESPFTCSFKLDLGEERTFQWNGEPPVRFTWDGTSLWAARAFS